MVKTRKTLTDFKTSTGPASKFTCQDYWTSGIFVPWEHLLLC